MQWSTGSTNTTITVTAPGEYIAYYGNGLDVTERLVTSSGFGLYLARWEYNHPHELDDKQQTTKLPTHEHVLEPNGRIA